MHIVQLIHSEFGRRVGIIEEPKIIFLDKKITSSYQLFNEIINAGSPTVPRINELLSGETLLYDAVYLAKSPWHLLPPIDCADDAMRCMLSGTGLTHKASAENRQKMHETGQQGPLTDSMKMYLWGEEGGKPDRNQIGVQPEWFYKGNGHNLKGHGQPLVVPNYANDGGEEPEIAGVYLISEKCVPTRIGFTQANEFSDHVMEKKNYLYLAPSKIRNCAIGPELVTSNDFQSLVGKVSIMRGGSIHWSQSIHTGEAAMAHTLANLEYHHFKYEQHRLPGQLHIHFFGADAFSFGKSIRLEHGDEMEVHFERMGRPLVNVLHIDTDKEKMPEVKSLS